MGEGDCHSLGTVLFNVEWELVCNLLQSSYSLNRSSSRGLARGQGPSVTLLPRDGLGRAVSGLVPHSPGVGGWGGKQGTARSPLTIKLEGKLGVISWCTRFS